MRNTVSLVMFELERGVPSDQVINVTMIMQYNGGLLVNYSHSYASSFATGTPKDRTVTEHRTAFFQIISIDTDNDNVQKKWDFIC